MERVKYCSRPNEVSIIKFCDDDDWDYDKKVVFRVRLGGDFSLDELRDILIWAEQEIKRR
jgi:hypothetical protein